MTQNPSFDFKCNTYTYTLVHMGISFLYCCRCRACSNFEITLKNLKSALAMFLYMYCQNLCRRYMYINGPDQFQCLKTFMWHVSVSILVQHFIVHFITILYVSQVCMINTTWIKISKKSVSLVWLLNFLLKDIAQIIMCNNFSWKMSPVLSIKCLFVSMTFQYIHTG